MCVICLSIRTIFFAFGTGYLDFVDNAAVYSSFLFCFELLQILASGVIFTQSLEWISQIYIIKLQKNKRVESIYSDHISEIIDRNKDKSQQPEYI